MKSNSKRLPIILLFALVVLTASSKLAAQEKTENLSGITQEIRYFSEYFDSEGKRLQFRETTRIPIQLQPGDEVVINGLKYLVGKVVREHRDGPKNLFLNFYKYQLQGPMN